MLCSACKSSIPLEDDKRVVCPDCGSDFGFVVLRRTDGRIHLNPPKPRTTPDRVLNEYLSRVYIIERLCELSQ